MAASTHPARPLVTVDVALFTFMTPALFILLIQRRHPPFAGAWALPGGFVDEGEGLEQAAQRELAEETGLTGVRLAQLHTFGDPDRDPRGRVITVAYLACTGSDQALQARPGPEARATAWHATDALPELAFDHDRIIAAARERLRADVEQAPLLARLLPPLFTLGELQQALTAARQEDVDKRNFRRKILSSGLIEPTGRYRYGDHRPAQLFRLRES